MPKFLLAAGSVICFIIGCNCRVYSQSTKARQETKPPRQNAMIVRNSIDMKFKPLKGGTFTMGEGKSTHQVTLTKRFDMGVYEVTQEQYEKVMGKNPSKFKGAKNPVEHVSWDDAVEFCRKLSELPAEKAAGRTYRLPTEAEWEYACRAGTTTKYCFGDDVSSIGDYAWYRKNSAEKSHIVGQKKPNNWGLYDMHGNVNEWCQDRSGGLSSDPVTDPTGSRSGSHRVYRGGSWWFEYPDRCRSAYRSGGSPSFQTDHLGFRVARSPFSQNSK